MTNRLNRLTENIGLIVAIAILGGIAAWGVYVFACAYNPQVSVCRWSGGQYLAMFAPGLLVLISAASALHDKLHRRLTRGMYTRRPSPLAWRVPTPLRSVAHFAIYGELPDTWADGRTHPALYDDRQGWWVYIPADNGTNVWVGRQSMYEWVIDVLARDVVGSQSPIGRLYWEPRIGKYQWMARVELLRDCGAARQTTDHPSSLRFFGTSALSIMESLEEVRQIETN